MSSIAIHLESGASSAGDTVSSCRSYFRKLERLMASLEPGDLFHLVDLALIFALGLQYNIDIFKVGVLSIQMCLIFFGVARCLQP